MTTYIALLRGINVAGKVVKMEDLRAVFTDMGFQNVKTYIQSGNVLFEAADPKGISIKLEEVFGFPIPVFLRTVEELEEVRKQNPFPDQEPYITFMDKEPASDAIEALENFARDFEEELKVIGREAFLYCPSGYGRTKFSNTFLEKKLGVSGTTRNWKTLNKLIAMSGE